MPNTYQGALTGQQIDAIPGQIESLELRITDLSAEVYDVTANNDNTKFASLSALLSSLILDTLIPTAVRKGGMSIKFVQSSDNKYVQYRLMNQNWSIVVTDWQGVDKEITKGSHNLAESGSVVEHTKDLKQNILFDGTEDTFYITDKNGNVIAKIDEDGVHSVDFLDKDGNSIIGGVKFATNQKVSDISIVSEPSIEDVDAIVSSQGVANALKPFNENVFAESENDSLYICDSRGYAVAVIDKDGIRAIQYLDKNGNSIKSKSLSGKQLFTLCDSLGTSGTWQSKLAELTGMEFDNSINIDTAYPLSVGGTTTSVSGSGTMTRAKNLVEHWKTAMGEKVDVLIIENINDTSTIYGHGEDTDAAWFLNQLVTLETIQSNSAAAESYFNTNRVSIVSGITPTFGTTIQVPYSSGTAYRLTVTSAASSNGDIVITIGTFEFVVGVTTGDSISDIVDKIAEYDYSNAGYNVYKESSSSVLLTKVSGEYTVTINTNSTGVSITSESTTGVNYLDFCYVGTSIETSAWQSSSNWMEQISGGGTVVTLWSKYKGLFDYLYRNLPDTQIYFLIAPRMSISIANTYKKTDGTYDVKAWMEAYKNSTFAVRDIQKSAAKMYGITVIDMFENGNFTLANADYNYAGGSGVHPGINGYNRMAEVIARFINY